MQAGVPSHSALSRLMPSLSTASRFVTLHARWYEWQTRIHENPALTLTEPVSRHRILPHGAATRLPCDCYVIRHATLPHDPATQYCHMTRYMTLRRDPAT